MVGALSRIGREIDHRPQRGNHTRGPVHHVPAHHAAVVGYDGRREALSDRVPVTRDERFPEASREHRLQHLDLAQERIARVAELDAPDLTRRGLAQPHATAKVRE